MRKNLFILGRNLVRPLVSFNKFSFVYFPKYRFTDLNRLDFDKLGLGNKASTSQPSDKKAFDKDSMIVNFQENSSWENEVLKSDLPVVVDCYAE